MSLQSCFQKCEKEKRCDAITYGWAEKSCFLRGQVTWDKCEKSWEYTTFHATAIASVYRGG